MRAIIKRLQNLSEEEITIIRKRFITIAALLLITITVLYYILQLVRNAPLFQYTDFRNIYTGAIMGLHHSGKDLYSLSYQFHIQHVFSPIVKRQTWLLPFLAPPFMTLFLSPLAFLSVETAYIVWGICNIFMILMLCWFTYRMLLPIRWQFKYLAISMILTCFPVWETLLQGQLSFLLVLSLFFGWYYMKKKKDFLGGFTSSLLVIKPHFIFLLLIFFLLKRRYSFLGLITGLSILLLISLSIVGIDGMKNYLSVLLSISAWGETYGMHPQMENTWGGLLTAYVHTNTISQIFVPWFTGVGIVFCLFLWIMIKKVSFDLQWALLILVMVFIGPHVFFHDVSLLLIPGITIAHYVAYNTKVLKQSTKLFLLAIPIIGYLVTIIDFTFLWFHLFVHLTVWFLIGSILLLCLILYKKYNLGTT